MTPAADGARLAASVRAEFPLLAECVYMNSNSTGATPRGAERVLGEYWDTLRHWRDSAWEAWLARHRAYADALAALVGAPAGSVVTDASTSALLGRLGTCFDLRPPRNRIVTTDLEFPSVPFLWRGFARHGAELVVVPSKEGTQIDEDALAEAIDERTLFVCVSHATFGTGALVDIERVVRRAHDVGALAAVDAYQSVGTVPIDVRALGVDFLVAGAHKWLCGRESAFLYVRPELTPSLFPAAAGWMASADPLSFSNVAEYAPDARRFAAGTPAVLGALVSQVGLDIVREVGVETIRALSLAHTERIVRRADDAGLRVRTPREAKRRGGIVSLSFPGDADVARALNARGFVCSYRGAVRVAPHFYNTPDEVERFMDALSALAKERRS
jgi:selenocysteine lyase/cysteine desulfurase